MRHDADDRARLAVDAGDAGLKRFALTGFTEEHLARFFETPAEPGKQKEGLAALYAEIKANTQDLEEFVTNSPAMERVKQAVRAGAADLATGRRAVGRRGVVVGCDGVGCGDQPVYQELSYVAVLIGSTIGSGIFRSPAGITNRLPGPLPLMSVWIAGGLLKGADVDPLVAAVAPRLAGVVLLGRDRVLTRLDALRQLESVG